MISSPGSARPSSAAIMASVEPQQTATSRSGSISMPCHRAKLSAIARRKSRAPHVMEYWLMSAAMACCAAALISSGAEKSGKPCARLTAPSSMAYRDISRITDSVNCWTFWLIRVVTMICARSFIAKRLDHSGHILVAKALLDGVLKQAASGQRCGELHIAAGSFVLGVADVLGHQAQEEVDGVVLRGHTCGDGAKQRASGSAGLEECQRLVAIQAAALDPCKGLGEGCDLDRAQKVVDQ